MHRLEHALIVLRDLRRQRNAMIAPGVYCSNDEIEAIKHIDNAISEIRKAQAYLKVDSLRYMPNLITEAIRAIDLRGND